MPVFVYPIDRGSGNFSTARAPPVPSLCMPFPRWDFPLDVLACPAQGTPQGTSTQQQGW